MYKDVTLTVQELFEKVCKGLQESGNPTPETRALGKSRSEKA